MLNLFAEIEAVRTEAADVYDAAAKEVADWIVLPPSIQDKDKLEVTLSEGTPEPKQPKAKESNLGSSIVFFENNLT